jgi:hypothetical protein
MFYYFFWKTFSDILVLLNDSMRLSSSIALPKILKSGIFDPFLTFY